MIRFFHRLNIAIMSITLVVSSFFAPWSILAAGEGARAYRTSSSTVASGAWTAIVFNAESWDDANYFTINTSVIDADDSGHFGIYLACCNLTWASNAAGRRYVAIYRNGGAYQVDGRMAITVAGATTPVSICAAVPLSVIYDYIQCYGFQDSGSDLSVLSTGNGSHFTASWLGPVLDEFPATATPAPTATPQPTPTPISSVDGLPGLLADCQDACWWQTLPITVTGLVTDDVMSWSGSIWEPAMISATGGISDMVEISGTVTVIISDTTRFTETLTSGHLMAISRTFSYGEASIAIGLFLLMSIFALVSIFWFVRR